MDKIEWLESMNTLHNTVEMLYTVDGYLLTHTYDSSPIATMHGETLSEAIDKAINAGWCATNAEDLPDGYWIG